MTVKNVPEFFQGSREEHARLIAQGVNGLLKGQSNNVYTVTLDPTPATSTSVTVIHARPGQVAQLVAQSAAAAAEVAAGTIYTEVQNGSIVIYHAAGGSDRTFGVVLNG
jgi:N-acetylmuramic acid 6-phosphate (MurNAc-6-P) etherase